MMERTSKSKNLYSLRKAEEPDKFRPWLQYEFNRQLALMRSNGHPVAKLAKGYNFHRFCRNINFEVYLNEAGEPVGAIGYTFDRPWWNYDVLILCEQFVLAPHCPGFGRFATFRFEAIAKEWGCKVIYAGNTLGIQQKQTENLYMKKAGYQVKDSNFTKVVDLDEH